MYMHIYIVSCSVINSYNTLMVVELCYAKKPYFGDVHKAYLYVLVHV